MNIKTFVPIILLSLILSFCLIFSSCNPDTVDDGKESSESTTTLTDTESNGEMSDTSDTETDGSSETENDGIADTDADTSTGTEDSSTVSDTTNPPETNDTPVTDPHTHAYGEWQVIKSPSCSEKGSRKRVCSCGHAQTESISTVSHTPVKDAATAPTCTKDGKSEGSHCSVCNKVLTAQSRIPAKGHSEVDVAGYAPTDVTPGLTTGKKCSVCKTVTVEQKTIAPYLESCNSDYCYTDLASRPNGSAMQTLYTRIDTEAKDFHSNASKNASDNVAFSISVSDLGLSVEQIIQVWLAYKNDHPLFYWISTSVNVDSEVLGVLVDSTYAQGSARVQYNTGLYKKITDYVSIASGETNAYQIALAYHDAIIEAIDYAYESDGYTPESDLWAHSIVGVFDEKGGVCEAYARTFQLLLNVSGVENIFVSGIGGNGMDSNADENHAWNMVKLGDGQWYWCDLTWDDRPGWEWGICYNYFCVNDTQNVNWSDDCDPLEHKTFLDYHKAGLSMGESPAHNLTLPARSGKVYTDSSDLILRKTFKVGGISYITVGYRAVQLTYCENSGALIIPEKVSYNGKSYTVISIGGLRTDGLLGEGPSPTANSTSVTLNKSMRFIWDNALEGYSIESFSVDAANPYFTAKDGALYTKSLYTLIKYPRAKKGDSLVIPDATGRVAKNAIYAMIKSLHIGKNVISFGFANWGAGYADAPITEGFAGNIIQGDLGGLLYNRGQDTGLTITVDPQNTNIKSVNGIIYANGEYGLHTVLSAASTEVTTLTVENGVTHIDQYAFAGCKKLTEVSLPASITTISDIAFDAPNLKTIRFGGTVAQWNAIDKSDYWQSGSYEAPVVKIICSDGTLNSK